MSEDTSPTTNTKSTTKLKCNHKSEKKSVKNNVYDPTCGLCQLEHGDIMLAAKDKKREAIEKMWRDDEHADFLESLDKGGFR